MWIKVVLLVFVVIALGVGLALLIIFSIDIKKFIRKKTRKHTLKKVVHEIKVEPTADRDAMAFALAASDIPSEDMLIAANAHPAIKNRFSARGKNWIAREAVLLRKDEHFELLRDPKWRRTIVDHQNRESQEQSRDNRQGLSDVVSNSQNDIRIMLRMLNNIQRLMNRSQETQSIPVQPSMPSSAEPTETPKKKTK
jgi:hypothetical protein